MKAVVIVAISVSLSPQLFYASLGNRLKVSFGTTQNDKSTSVEAKMQAHASNASSQKQFSKGLETRHERYRPRRSQRNHPTRPSRSQAHDEPTLPVNQAKAVSVSEYETKPDDNAIFDKPAYEKEDHSNSGVLVDEAEAGSKLHIRELQPLRKHVGRVLSRFFLGRHDYVVEGMSSEPAYILKGKAWSMHQRFHLHIPGEPVPRFTIRRAWGNYNPAGAWFGQYVYRVLPYQAEPETGLKNVFNYHTGRSLFTITKDRFGRGAFWQRQEWRIYKGTGGCWFWGVLSCDKKKQIYYGLSKGLKDFLSYDMEVFEGQWPSAVKSMAGNGKSAKLYSGVKLDRAQLDEIKVAETTHGSGESRPLTWAASWFNSISQGSLAALRYSQEAGLVVPTMLIPVNFALQVARMLWVDKYELQFVKATDKLLMTILVALQDVSNDYDKRLSLANGASNAQAFQRAAIAQAQPR